MDRRLRDIVAPQLQAWLPTGCLLAFVAVGRCAHQRQCQDHAEASRARILARLGPALEHGVEVPFLDGARCPLVAWEPRLVDNPIAQAAAQLGLRWGCPVNVDRFLRAQQDPLDRQEMWQVYNAGEPSWPSACYLRNQVVDVAWWPAAHGPPFVQGGRLRRHFAARGSYFIACLVDGTLGVTLCFWQEDFEAPSPGDSSRACSSEATTDADADSQEDEP